jgi:hypothetical protein
VENTIEGQIDQVVNERVAEIVKGHLSKELEDEAAEHRRQLGELQRALHNS